MKWHEHPSLVDQLASSYVLGTLQGRARARFEAVMQTRPNIAAVVSAWTDRLSPLHTALPSLEPKASLWKSIAIQTQLLPRAIAPSRAWWQNLLMPLPIGAMVIGLGVGGFVPVLWQMQSLSQRQSVLPESYVGVLATPSGKTGLTVSSLRQGKIVEMQQASIATLAAAQTLYLWRIDKDGQVAPVAVIPNEKWSKISLSEPSEAVFSNAVELAVSIEATGSTPSKPSQAFIYRGLCGKFWKWK